MMNFLSFQWWNHTLGNYDQGLRSQFKIYFYKKFLSLSPMKIQMKSYDASRLDPKNVKHSETKWNFFLFFKIFNFLVFYRHQVMMRCKTQEKKKETWLASMSLPITYFTLFQCEIKSIKEPKTRNTKGKKYVQTWMLYTRKWESHTLTIVVNLRESIRLFWGSV